MNASTLPTGLALALSLLVVLVSGVAIETSPETSPKPSAPNQNQNNQMSPVGLARWCERFLANERNGSGNASRDSLVQKCRRVKARILRQRLTTGKQAIYMRKLWKALSEVKDNSGSDLHAAQAWLPHEINLAQKTITFNRCFDEKWLSRKVETPAEGHLTRIELVVPHNHTSNTDLGNGRLLIAVQVNGETVAPSEATIVVDGTLTFDLTFLAPVDTKHWCQLIKVTLYPAPNVKAFADRSFLYEFYNLNNDTLTRFRNLTHTMSLKGNIVPSSVSDDVEQSPSSSSSSSSSPVERTKRDSDDQSCRVHPLVLDMQEDLGLRAILYPLRVDVGQCLGKCSESPDIHGATEYNTGHSVLLNSLEITATSSCKADARMTCVPKDMGGHTFHYAIDHILAVMKTLPAVVINSCRCV